MLTCHCRRFFIKNQNSLFTSRTYLRVYQNSLVLTVGIRFTIRSDTLDYNKLEVSVNLKYIIFLDQI